MAWAVWITGLPGSGKSTVARRVAEALAAEGVTVEVLELDEIRQVLTPEPTYTDAEREVVYRALVYMAKLLTGAGRPVLIDATAHRRAWRELARRLIPAFAEARLVCPIDVCAERERHRRGGHAPRDIYARAGRPGSTVPGVDLPYEASPDAELVLDTHGRDLGAVVRDVVDLARRLDRSAPSATRHAHKETRMHVKEWMSASPITVTPDTPMYEARRLMQEKQVRHLPVTDRDRLVGILTDRDIRLNLPSPATSLSVWEINYLLARLTVGEVMTRGVVTIAPDRPAEEAARLMLERRIGALPVVEDGRLVGIITETDLLRAWLP